MGPDGARERLGVVLLSGGLDSTTVAAHAVREGVRVRALSIAYGQRHARELAAARAVAAALGIELIEADAGFYGRLAAHSALTSAAYAVPGGRPAEQMAAEVPITYVPLRNTFFVTVAAAALESWLLDRIEREGADPGALEGRIYVGANAIDYSGYPDCRPEFYRALEEVLRLGSKTGTVYGVAMRIEAPIITMSKAEIVRHGLALGAPLALTWSCYAGGERPCGTCDACRLRAAGFEAAGVPDPAAGSG
ncbi:MAG: 7-cyano-7-deazaguanine synthase [Tepidiforma sp.]|nr:7-cyano-7-deazaguanine synthase QueC [Tepidiforma sp.]GIW18757.1 MAG: 7-cyano-7-deazaguanine synthase [Tepidiforma sp.]